MSIPRWTRPRKLSSTERGKQEFAKRRPREGEKKRIKLRKSRREIITIVVSAGRKTDVRRIYAGMQRRKAAKKKKREEKKEKKSIIRARRNSAALSPLHDPSPPLFIFLVPSGRPEYPLISASIKIWLVLDAVKCVFSIRQITSFASRRVKFRFFLNSNEMESRGREGEMAGWVLKHLRGRWLCEFLTNFVCEDEEIWRDILFPIQTLFRTINGRTYKQVNHIK